MRFGVFGRKQTIGYISLAAAARGFGGRQLGSYQDAITDDRFAQVRDREHQANPGWPLVESVIKVPIASVEALFTDGTEIKAHVDELNAVPVHREEGKG